MAIINGAGAQRNQGIDSRDAQGLLCPVSTWRVGDVAAGMQKASGIWGGICAEWCVVEPIGFDSYKIIYSAVDEKPEITCKCLKELVGANGFEPSTSWSRI